MTRRDLLDDHMDDFGAQLRRASAPKRTRTRAGRRWVRPAIGIGGLATLGAGAAAVTLFPVAGGRIDIVSEAKAALANSGGIVHLVINQKADFVDGGPGKPAPAAMRHQQLRQSACIDWNQQTSIYIATTGPSRYRASYPTSRCTVGVLHRQVIEPGVEQQTSFADGAYQQYYPSQRLLLRTTDLLPSDRNLAEPAAVAFGMQDSLSGESDPVRDPMDRIRSLLAAGELRDAGRFFGPDGRALWRLRGATPAVDTYREKGATRDTEFKTFVEYVVDGKTFAPVSFSAVRRTYPEGKPGPAFGTKLTFVKYEQLPLNAETDKLVEIQPAEGTKVVSLTSRQIRKLNQSAKGRSAEDRDAYEKARATADRNQAEADAEVEAQIRSEERTAEKSTTP
ncbi:MAG: hypothetical protein Q7T55_26555 [Solirubrobacteraceae bacterium]|nr:hypothetical protein [Solirubrobacteraceae bacterium]